MTRNLVGGGVRLALQPSSARFNVYLGIGAMWEHERINDKSLGEITTPSRSFDELHQLDMAIR